jgi:hypothetical protein
LRRRSRRRGRTVARSPRMPRAMSSVGTQVPTEPSRKVSDGPGPRPAASRRRSAALPRLADVERDTDCSCQKAQTPLEPPSRSDTASSGTSADSTAATRMPPRKYGAMLRRILPVLRASFPRGLVSIRRGRLTRGRAAAVRLRAAAGDRQEPPPRSKVCLVAVDEHADHETAAERSEYACRGHLPAEQAEGQKHRDRAQ